MTAFTQKSIFFLLLFPTYGMAQSTPAYDPLCQKMAKTWKLPNTKSSSKEIITNVAAMRKKSDLVVNKQLQIWKEVDQVSDCLSEHAGLMFTQIKVIDQKTKKEVTKDYLIVNDSKKVERFRLAKNNLECQINDAPFIYIGQNRYQDNTRVVNMYTTQAANERYQQAYQDYKENELDKNEKIRKDIFINNNLGDVGLDNYCAHQLQMWQLSEKSHDLRNKRRACEKAKDDGTLQDRASCKDFPEKMSQEMKLLAKEMDSVFADTDYQPYDLMNNIDKQIYAQFKGDVSKLKEAQALAEKSLRWSYDAEAFLKQNNLWGNNFESCGEVDPVNSKQFNQGIESCANYEPILELEPTQFSANVEAVKNIHRDHLIKELNLKAFGDNTETAFHLLEHGTPAEQSIRKNLWALWNNKVDTDSEYYSACKQIADSSLCTNPLYYQQFKNGFKRAMTGIKKLEELKAKGKSIGNVEPEAIVPPGTFLRYDSGTVARNINQALSSMQKICESLDSNLLGFNPEAQKQLESNYREYLKYLQNYAGYFYDGVIKDKTQIEKWLHGCPLDNKTSSSPLTSEDIERSKEGFREANKNQMKLVSDFAKPDRGGHSNLIGELACGKYGKEKEDLYALSALLTSHPYMTGQILGSVDQMISIKEKNKTGVDKSTVDVEKKIYTKLFCEAKTCSQGVHHFNDEAADVVRNAAVAASFLPLPGVQFWTTAVYLAADIGQVVVNHNEANEKKELIQEGLVSGGFSPDYDADIANKIRKLEEKGSIHQLAEDIFISLAVQGAAMGTAQFTMKGLKYIKKDVVERLIPILKSSKPASKLESELTQTLIALEKKAVGNEKVVLQNMIKHIHEKGAHHVVENSFGLTFYSSIYDHVQNKIKDKEKFNSK
ncbi:MAG: hypothetical protein ACOYL6_19095 [Bacteriovoracaceae bacterium]